MLLVLVLVFRRRSNYGSLVLITVTVFTRGFVSWRQYSSIFYNVQEQLTCRILGTQK